MKLSFRRATADDAIALSGLIKESMEEYRIESSINSGVLESITESISSILYRIKNSETILIIDEDEKDTILGTISLTVDNPAKYCFSRRSEDKLVPFGEVIYISRFAVKSTKRRSGLGLMLLNEAIRVASMKNVEAIILHTALSNSRMCDFYRQNDFGLVDFDTSRGYERGLFLRLLRKNPMGS